MQRGRRPSAAGRERVVTASTGSSRSDYRQLQSRLSHLQVFFLLVFSIVKSAEVHPSGLAARTKVLSHQLYTTPTQNSTFIL